MVFLGAIRWVAIAYVIAFFSARFFYSFPSVASSWRPSCCVDAKLMAGGYPLSPRPPLSPPYFPPPPPPPPPHSQVPLLLSLKAKGEANGVHDLRLMSGLEAVALEPNLKVGPDLPSWLESQEGSACRGIHVPVVVWDASTGLLRPSVSWICLTSC